MAGLRDVDGDFETWNRFGFANGFWRRPPAGTACAARCLAGGPVRSPACGAVRAAGSGCRVPGSRRILSGELGDVPQCRAAHPRCDRRLLVGAVSHAQHCRLSTGAQVRRFAKRVWHVVPDERFVSCPGAEAYCTANSSLGGSRIRARVRSDYSRWANAALPGPSNIHYADRNQAPLPVIEGLHDPEPDVLCCLGSPALTLCRAAFFGVAEPQH